MKRLLTVIVAMFMLGLSAFGQTPDHAFGQTPDQKNKRDANVARELRNLVRQWDDVDVKGDAAALDRLLAREFTFVGGQTKAQYLASVKNLPPELTIESALSTDLEVQVYGNTAIVTGLDTIKGKNKGQLYTNKWLYMDVWINRGGRWQCVKTYSTLAK
jgi:ketosteroid isomerase-like protein